MFLFHVCQVGAIVNSTDTSLQLDLAALSRSILEAGGDTLRDECKTNAPGGIKCGEVVVTSGGQLQCQYVIHGAVCSWSDGQCKEVHDAVHVITTIIIIIIIIIMQPQCPVVERRPQHCASTSACLALSSARWYPSSSGLVRLSTVSPVFL